MFITIIAYIFIIANALGFLLTVIDRISAKVFKNLRIHENILLLIACLLGGFGVMLGLFFTPRGLYKPEFRLGIPAIALGELILLFWALPGFFDVLKSIF